MEFNKAMVKALIESINARRTCAILPQYDDARALMDACGIEGGINEIPVTWGNQVLICYTSRGEHREFFAGIDGGGVTVCDAHDMMLEFSMDENDITAHELARVIAGDIVKQMREASAAGNTTLPLKTLDDFLNAFAAAGDLESIRDYVNVIIMREAYCGRSKWETAGDAVITHYTAGRADDYIRYVELMEYVRGLVDKWDRQEAFDEFFEALEA